ncbi:hypothetical protein [Streptomyces eurythermus]
MTLTRLTPEQAETLGRQLARATGLWRQLAEALLAMARQLTRAAVAVTDFVRRRQAADPFSAATRQRPAWMSSYGPPTGRHRRH